MTETKMQLADCKSQLELVLGKAVCIAPSRAMLQLPLARGWIDN